MPLLELVTHILDVEIVTSIPLTLWAFFDNQDLKED